MKRSWLYLLLVLCLVSWGLSQAIPTNSAFSGASSNTDNIFSAAASFCTAAGPQTLNANADSWVQELLPVLNHGTESTTQLQSATANNARLLVRFPLPALPAYCQVTSATLRLYATSSAAGRTIEVYRAAAAWTETGVTWTNQPTTTGSAVTATGAAGWVQWDVTDQVQSQYAGSDNGFVVRDRDEGALGTNVQVYAAREDATAAHRPELVITVG
jgi:hypothetical protein